MLDLDELERKIDAALAKETPESLTSWLMSKRSSDVETYIGEGDYVPCKFNFLQEYQKVVPEKQALIPCDHPPSAGNIQYAMAA
jgi:hypothetical protein